VPSERVIIDMLPEAWAFADGTNTGHIVRH
jgi:hypothetical protein